MELQKKWYECGTESVNALSEFLNFEKTFRPELEKKIDEHDRLESQAEKLESKLTAARVDFDRAKTVFFAGLREAETKLRADTRAELCTPANKKKVSDDDIESQVFAGLEKRAVAVTTLRKPALSILTLERDLAEMKMQISMIESEAFQRRREVARNFCTNLFNVAGLNVQHKIYNQELSEASRWSKQMANLNERLKIAEGSLKHFAPIIFMAASADGVLEFAAYLPGDVLPQVLAAWRACKLECGKSAKLKYTAARILKWSFLKTVPENKKTVGFTSSDYGRGSTSRQRAV